MSEGVEVRRARRTDDPAIFDCAASLHSDLIHGGILPLLGKPFLSDLYREIAGTESGFVGFAMRGRTVIGFIAGASDIWKCAGGFRISGYARLGLRFGIRAAKPPVLRKAFDALAYPFRKEENSASAPPKHRAELLAIAVDRTAQGHGVGRLLVAAFEDFLKPRVTAYFVTTNIDEPKANAFYRANGFAEAGRKKHHSLMLQTYSKRLH